MNAVWLCGLFLGSGLALAQAGSVTVFGNGPEVDGKLTLNPATIHVEGSSSAEINLGDVLEADFGETPFQLNFFSSNNTPGQLPPDWKAQAVGHPDKPGSFTYANGTFTLHGSTGSLGSRDDTIFFVSQPWTGDGQWTARLKQTDGMNQTEGGLLVRDSMDAKSPMCAVGMTNLNPTEGWSYFRGNPGDSSDIRGTSVDLPAWFRISRNGESFDVSVSSDGKQWGGIYSGFGKLGKNISVGLYINSRRDKTLGRAVFDHVSFTPPPCEAQVVPAGVLLRSGSFLAGYCNPLDFDPSAPDKAGNFNRNGKNVVIPPSKIAAVAVCPAARSEMAAAGSQVGFIMRNGDFLAGDLQAINGGGVRISSVVLGIVSYDRAEVRACILRPVEPQPSNYEIRLKDGSIIRADSLSANNGQLVIHEISGLAVEVDPGEIAQFRGGTAKEQSLLELPWKVVPLPAPPMPVAPAPHAAPAAANTAPAAVPPNPLALNLAPEQAPTVQCWQGPNEEQIMAVPVGAVDFPLKGKFRALALKVALSPDAPPKAQATLRILADGKEIARTPSFQAGEPPRWVQVTLPEPGTVTLVADSLFAGTRVLFIDPVVIRENQP